MYIFAQNKIRRSLFVYHKPRCISSSSNPFLFARSNQSILLLVNLRNYLLLTLLVQFTIDKPYNSFRQFRIPYTISFLHEELLLQFGGEQFILSNCHELTRKQKGHCSEHSLQSYKLLTLAMTRFPEHNCTTIG